MAVEPIRFVVQVININGIKVTNYHFISQDEILIELKNVTNKVHQNCLYKIGDIPLSNYQVFLQVDRRRFRCTQRHRVFSDKLDFVAKRKTYKIKISF